VRVAAIIPARGGSKRLPMKNMARVGGQTLVERAVLSAALCDDIWVSTDDPAIAAHAALLGVRVLMRPAHLATDVASTEAVMQHWWRSLRSGERPDAICLLQPTSPLRTHEHVAEAVELLETSGADSVVSVRLNLHAHFVGRSYPREGWREFRPFRPRDWRPRTQDARELTEENGAIYLTRRESWERTGNRMGGVIAELRMSDAESVDIDTADDLAVAEALLAARAVYGKAEGA
jgi:CMP-N,N'-diacetyllegionaminic acid synthase